MPINLTPLNAWTATITSPVNGDPIDASTSGIQEPFQALSNRTEYLYNKVSPLRVVNTAFNYGPSFVAPSMLTGAPATAGYRSFTNVSIGFPGIQTGDIIIIEASFRATCSTFGVYANFAITTPSQPTMNPASSLHRTYFNAPTGGVVFDPKTVRDIRLMHRYVSTTTYGGTPLWFISTDRSDIFLAENVQMMAWHLRP